MKTYRRHPCSSRHRTHLTLAKCIWRRAAWIDGEGPYALVSRCGHGPHEHSITVTLHKTTQAAEESKDLIDRTGCGGRCSGQHEIVQLELGE